MGSTSSYKNGTRNSSEDEDDVKEIFPPSRRTFKKQTLEVIQPDAQPRKSFKKKSPEVIETYRSSQLKKDVDIVETYQSPQLKKKNTDNEVHILKERSSFSREGRGHHSPFSRKPFKVGH